MAKVVHFEIPVGDPARTVKFFSTVFGWKFIKWGDMEYYLTESGSEHETGIDGAIMKWNYPEQPVVITIQVDDIDATTRAIEENGGEIVMPGQRIPGVGTQCYFKDPSGHIHGAIEMEKPGREIE